jgi:hypothetical protein
MDERRSGCVTQAQMVQGFAKAGAAMQEQQLVVMCMRPFGDKDIFEYKECKSLVAGDMKP